MTNAKDAASATSERPSIAVLPFNNMSVDAALDLLERSVPRLGPELTEWIKHDSDFEALRDHPRYHKILG